MEELKGKEEVKTENIDLIDFDAVLTFSPLCSDSYFWQFRLCL